MDMRTQPVAGRAADMSLGSAILVALGAAWAATAAHAAEPRPNQAITPASSAKANRVMPGAAGAARPGAANNGEPRR